MAVPHVFRPSKNQQGVSPKLTFMNLEFRLELELKLELFEGDVRSDVKIVVLFSTKSVITITVTNSPHHVIQCRVQLLNLKVLIYPGRSSNDGVWPARHRCPVQGPPSQNSS